MRMILASAGIALLATSSSAMAADCTKGLLWPYVRHPGDCLTDAEIQAGKTAVYSGPATGQVDVSTIKPPSSLNAASSNAIQCSHSWYWPFGSGDCQAAPATSASSSAGSGTAADSPAAKDDPSGAQPGSTAPAVKPQAAASPAAPLVLASVQPRPAIKPQPAVVLAAATIQVAQANTAECHKGILWPFVRDDGDCPTTAEAGNGKTSAAPIPASTPAAMPVSGATVPPPVQPVAAISPTTAATCTKGTFWPFIREAGDCPTAAEMANGKTPAVPTAASEPAAMPVSAAAPPSPAPAVQPAAVATPTTTGTCTRGTFWPFVREAGDCPTAAEKASGKTSAAPAAPIDASARAADPVVVPAAATVPEQAAPAQNSGPPAANLATCHKGLFWPFVREAGDCPTDADKGPQHNPS